MKYSDHPVDVMIAMCADAGITLDPAMIAEARAICDADAEPEITQEIVQALARGEARLVRLRMNAPGAENQIDMCLLLDVPYRGPIDDNPRTVPAGPPPKNLAWAEFVAACYATPYDPLVAIAAATSACLVERQDMPTHCPACSMPLRK